MKTTSSLLRLVLLVSIQFCLPRLEAQTATNSSGTPHPHLMQQLGLSDAQKAQIKEIRENTPKGKARRQEIAAVLTPEQKAQLKQEIEQKKAQHQ